MLYGKFYRFQSRWSDEELVDMIRAAVGQAKTLDTEGTEEPTYVVNSVGKRVAFRSLVSAHRSMKSLLLGKSALAMKAAMKSAKDPGGGGSDDDEDELDPGEDHVWVALEAIEGHVKKGQEVALVEGDARVGDRALPVLSCGDSVAVKRVPVEEAADGEDGGDPVDPVSDVRVLTPLQLNAAGRRWAPFSGVVEKMVKEDMSD